jgi:hypothetical protein
MKARSSVVQWEYRTVALSDLPARALEVDLLNELGRDGWELVSIAMNGVAYFKRAIAPAKRPPAKPPAST